ncbi:RagB/SusD family nutrient uptake outer membrane protein [Pedobacter sp. MC2016-24]|uniref:RagB/SusD family nutrient uptake outer membrane protein n=1 Tax=Pedobacter sp. MC2016-24 TaxID=2780090 RepID=UPI0018813A28|nr:RagB/SusD family nutrient uptake outer membrane protein [Pedobacter sp. MC2016-24]MBE9601034.1 RagB/SusD family nutrient uptake outer membrane protein [Pedobacter sp. MC2016-24]
MNRRFRMLIATLFVAGLMATGFNSCKKDYLNVDEYIYDLTNIDSVFANQDKLLTYINGIALYLPDEDKLWTSSWAPFQGASDENFTSWNDARHAGIKFMVGEITPFAANTYFNNYATWYKGINKANTVINRIDECKTLSLTTKRQFLGEMYFFKGYFMYLLVQQYGPAVLPDDKGLGLDADGMALSKERSSYDDCVRYITQNMEQAYDYLPDTQEALSDVYRPTKGAALATMSRVLLTAASPLFNGNQSYAGWTRTDGTPFISQTKDNNKWGAAAAAAKRIMDTGVYELYTYPVSSDTDPLAYNVPTATYPNGAGGIDPYRSYKYTFIGEVPANNNPEVIWCTRVNPTAGDSPLWLSSPAQLNGGNGLNITQDLVDAYKMKDGFDINSSSAVFPYPGVNDVYQPIGTTKNISDVQLVSNTAKMYNNREARFYATIGFNHSYWKGTSYTGSGAFKNVEVTYYSNGTAAPTVNFPNDYNHTGYTCIKYNHPVDNMQQTGSIMNKIFPIFRYAEVLLSYAEALNELNGSYTDPKLGITVSRDLNQIKSAFNRIRFRAGLPGLSAAELSSQESLRNAIKLERKVEFALEGRRYHDLRRWLDAPDAYSKPVVGMNVKATSSQRERFFTRTTISNLLTTRVWSFKNYFWPIPKNSMDKNSKLVQNPSW